MADGVGLLGIPSLVLINSDRLTASISLTLHERTHSNMGSLHTLFRHKKIAPIRAILMADGVGFEPTLDG